MREVIRLASCSFGSSLSVLLADGNSPFEYGSDPTSLTNFFLDAMQSHRGPIGTFVIRGWFYNADTQENSSQRTVVAIKPADLPLDRNEESSR